MVAEEFDYGALDPGVRDAVRALREAGFETTDSGDGASKPDCGVADERGVVENWEWPHVAVLSSREWLVSDADRLQSFLDAYEPGAWLVEATFWPRDGVALMLAVKGAPG